MFIVLGVLYGSYVHPITILSTLPSAGVWALVALLISGIDLSVIALAGLILLVGIVKKNAIMMIDFAIEAERDEVSHLLTMFTTPVVYLALDRFTRRRRAVLPSSGAGAERRMTKQKHLGERSRGAFAVCDFSGC